MTEPVPGQTPDPAVADAAEPPTAKAEATAPEPSAPQPADPEPSGTGAKPTGTEPTEAAPTAPEPNGAGPTGPEAGSDPTGAGPAAAVNPQELFGSLSLAAIEADIDRLMNDKMSQLDGMLAGLEDLVQRLEGEITNLEPPPDDPATP